MAGPAYQWGEWRFEPTECRLTRSGVVVPLPAKTLDLLGTLLKRAPRLVTKAEILGTVWPDAEVEEGNIAFHVAALRKAIDEGDQGSAIETVRGRGYRFVRDLVIHQLPPTEQLTKDAIARAETAREHEAPSVTAPRRAVIAGIVLTLVSAAAAYAWWLPRSASPSIAVEPFVIMNPAAGQENFPEGLGSYLTLALQRTGVTVAPLEHATSVLSGQLRGLNGGFAVTVRLTRTADNAREWEWSFDVPADADMPAPGTGPDDARSRLQGAIAGRTAAGLRDYFSLITRASVTR